MYLKELALKGFKSFSDSVRLELTPGINVIVGPNGSGKSNIVDAISWVLGAQAPKHLRLSKMEDIIFAGNGPKTQSRQARVELVLDNKASRIGLDLAEIQISREVSRTGDSRYQLNGRECRLLDIQELLADAAIGRAQHTIISQGNLDAILDAKPEDRRLVIEEAAGIAKYRRRQERTRRRLETVEHELVRAMEATHELKKRIKPLQRQAEVAKRYLDLNDEISQLKGYLLGAQYRMYLDRKDVAGQSCQKLVKQIADLDKSFAALAIEQSEAVQALSDLGDLAEVEALQRATVLNGRVERISMICRERSRALDAQLVILRNDSAIVKLEMLVTERNQERVRLEEEVLGIEPLLNELESDEQFLALQITQSSPDALETSLLRERELVERQRYLAVCDAKLHQENKSLEIAKIGFERRKNDSLRRLEDEEIALSQAGSDLEINRASSQRMASGRDELALKLESAINAQEMSLERLGVARVVYGAANAVLETLQEGSRSIHAKSHLELARTVAEPHGVLIELIDIEPGYERVIEAALYPWGLAVVQVDRHLALASFRKIREASPRATVLFGNELIPDRQTNDNLANDDLANDLIKTEKSRDVALAKLGLVPIAGLIRSSHRAVKELLDLWLDDCYFYSGSLDDFDTTFLGDGKIRVITSTGDLITDFGFEAFQEGEVVTRVALESARSNAGEAAFDKESAEKDYQAKQALRLELEAQLHKLDGELAKATSVVLSATNRIETSHSVQKELKRTVAELEPALRQTIAQLQACTAALIPVVAEAGQVNAELTQLRVTLESTRIALSKIDAERRALAKRRSVIELGAARLHERISQVKNQLVTYEDELASEKQRRALEIAQIVSFEAQQLNYVDLGERCHHSGQALRVILNQLTVDLGARKQLRADLDLKIASLVSDSERLSHAKITAQEQLDSATNELTEAGIRAQVTEERIWRELEIDPQVAIQIPILPGIAADNGSAHLAELVSELSSIGPINQLAVLELKELHQQQSFLSNQFADIEASKSELRSVEREIEREMREIFNLALTDVDSHFSAMFELLFPGGSAAIVLSDPANPLVSGLEFELSLPNKNLRRLALLSGGERSLVALAFLFAVFKSRPSPFYVLDEVEAALDDLNLGRLLALLCDFGRHAQLLIISHQKRTMEIADNLYGVTISKDGSSKVVADRLSARQLPLL